MRSNRKKICLVIYLGQVLIDNKIDRFCLTLLFRVKKTLNIFRVFDDGKTCWHGSGIYEDCNNVLWSRNLFIRYKGNNCKWWHFYPSETYADLRVKFQEIMNGKSENPLLQDLIKSAKDFQKEKLGTDLLKFLK